MQGQAHSVRATTVLVTSQHACLYFQMAGTYVLLQQTISWHVHHRNVEKQYDWPGNLIMLRSRKSARRFPGEQHQVARPSGAEALNIPMMAALVVPCRVRHTASKSNCCAHHESACLHVLPDRQAHMSCCSKSSTGRCITGTMTTITTGMATQLCSVREEPCAPPGLSTIRLQGQWCSISTSP